MPADNPRATNAGHPLHALIAPFPVALFSAALVTDLVYWRTAQDMWETFSIWLITFGLVVMVAAAVLGAVDFALKPRLRAQPMAWPHAIGDILALVLAFINAMVHSRDGYTAVVPTGLILSAVVVIVLVITGWMGDAIGATRR